EALVVSADGFVLASTPTDRLPGVEQLAAVVSGLTSLSNGAANLYQLDDVRQIIVEMTGGYLFVVSTGAGCHIGALTGPDCDLGDLGYELTVLSQRVAEALTPAVVDTLKNAIGPLR
ncbi:MAG: roadblock/LC7 domain-containing protein, partial [Actinomycetota bacterium]